jgi:hypothetical protein
MRCCLRIWGCGWKRRGLANYFFQEVGKVPVAEVRAVRAGNCGLTTLNLYAKDFSKINSFKLAFYISSSAQPGRAQVDFTMPPSLPAGQFKTLPRFACLNTRPFSTSNPLSAIGPENPKFIEVPTTLQPQVLPKLDIKGVLPTPRNLFPKRGANKTSKSYLKATTPLPKHQAAPANDYEAWKRTIAANRRQNLVEGLRTLKTRKALSDGRIAARSKKSSEERARVLNAPQREDERLTSPTITEAMRKLQLGSVPDPRREERVAAKAERVKANEAMREEARKNALHTLYMHARSFITTEEQLDAEIEKIFVDRPFGNDATSNNIWDAKGSPPTVQDLLATVNRSQKTAVDYHAGPAHITGQRMKKIAEELTGGRMD